MSVPVSAKDWNAGLQIIDWMAAEAYVSQCRNEQYQHGCEDKAATPVGPVDPGIWLLTTIHGESGVRTCASPFGAVAAHIKQLPGQGSGGEE